MHTSKVVVVLAVSVALTACGSGAGDGGGDAPSTPPAAEYGTCPSGDVGPRVHNIVGAATWEDPNDQSSAACTYPSSATNGCITGVTLGAVDTYDETGQGAIGNYYVQDTSDDPASLAPYSGVTVFQPTFSPPDLRVFPGDVLDVFGTAEEFAGPSSGAFDYCRTLPELAGTMGFRFDGVTPLQPKTIELVDLHSYDTARQWFGMLVRIENVTLSAATIDGSNRLTAHVPYVLPMETPGDNPSVDNELYDVASQGPDLSAQRTFRSITGIVTYFYSVHIAPRSPADFEE